MQNQVDIKTMTDEQVKALGFELRDQIDLLQNNLAIIRNELFIRSQKANNEAQTQGTETTQPKVSKVA